MRTFVENAELRAGPVASQVTPTAPLNGAEPLFRVRIGWLCVAGVVQRGHRELLSRFGGMYGPGCRRGRLATAPLILVAILSTVARLGARPAPSEASPPGATS